MEKNKKIIIILLAALVAVSCCLVLAVVLPRTDRTGELDSGSGSVSGDAANSAESVEESRTSQNTDTTDESGGDDESNQESDDSDTNSSQTEPETESGWTEEPRPGVIPETYFEEVNEQVTAKIEVNLRSSMDQGSEDNIVCTLANGDVAVRTGVGANGWSRIEYGSQILYCVSSYLTTDLGYTPPDDSDEFKTKFTTVNEKVTAKEATNLRDRPSVMEPSQVIYQLQHGEVALRTGIAGEGWSRVEYNGQVLYCISSYLELVEE